MCFCDGYQQACRSCKHNISFVAGGVHRRRWADTQDDADDTARPQNVDRIFATDPWTDAAKSLVKKHDAATFSGGAPKSLDVAAPGLLPGSCFGACGIAPACVCCCSGSLASLQCLVHANNQIISILIRHLEAKQSAEIPVPKSIPETMQELCVSNILPKEHTLIDGLQADTKEVVMNSSLASVEHMESMPRNNPRSL